MTTQINLLPDVPPMGARLVSAREQSHRERVRAELIKHAPAWARWWTQNACGSGYYWEHKPEANPLVGYWQSSIDCCKHVCETTRHDLPQPGDWQELIFEVTS